MNQNALMAGSLLLMLSVVVFTPFFFAPETPVIFYENPSLVLDYLNSTKEFRVYVHSIATNVRFQSIYMNLTDLTTNETVENVVNNTCAAFVNTTWMAFKLNVTVVLDEAAIYDCDITVQVVLEEGIATILLTQTDDGTTQTIQEQELPFPLAMKRRW
ncbi:MAG: hypothetical protein N3F63_05165 [Thermoplasmata archaeon]|nr:hypothetical protein [Thermoplasmata archaeon]